MCGLFETSTVHGLIVPVLIHVLYISSVSSLFSAATVTGRSGQQGSSVRCSVLCSHPDLTGVPSPAVPALTAATVAQSIPCADKAVMFVTLPVVALAVLSRHPPVLRRTNALATVTGAFAITYDSIGGLTQLFALGIAQIT